MKELDIPEPAFHLGIKGGAHGRATGRMIEEIEKVLLDHRPDCVVVYGDTNSTLAGALAAVKLLIPVAHIEAGLRTYDMTVPEEINRRLVDHVSHVLFTPSRRAQDSLKKEGLGDKDCFSGDIMYDSVLYYSEKLKSRGSRYFPNTPFIFMTFHREENMRSPESLRGVFEAISKMKHKVLFPVHPRTAKHMREHDIQPPENMMTIEPLGYLDTLAEVRASSMVITDSGGLQKEASFLGKNSLVLMESTVWQELVDMKVNALTGTNPAKILQAYEMFADNPGAAVFEPVYGSGNAASIICDTLLERL